MNSSARRKNPERSTGFPGLVGLALFFCAFFVLVFGFLLFACWWFWVFDHRKSLISSVADFRIFCDDWRQHSCKKCSDQKWAAGGINSLETYTNTLYQTFPTLQGFPFSLSPRAPPPKPMYSTFDFHSFSNDRNINFTPSGYSFSYIHTYSIDILTRPADALAHRPPTTIFAH